MKSLRTFAAFVAVAALALFAVSTNAVAPHKPNIIFILADDLG